MAAYSHPTRSRQSGPSQAHVSSYGVCVYIEFYSAFGLIHSSLQISQALRKADLIRSHMVPLQLMSPIPSLSRLMMSLHTPTTSNTARQRSIPTITTSHDLHITPAAKLLPWTVAITSPPFQLTILPRKPRTRCMQRRGSSTNTS